MKKHSKKLLAGILILIMLFIMVDFTKGDQLLGYGVEVRLEDIEVSLELAEQWLVNNIKENGVFHYQYNPNTNEYSGKNNILRQLMASRVLAELSNDDKTLRDEHKKNLDFMFEYWYKEEKELGFISYDDKSKLGTIAMALRTIVYSPYFYEYESEAKKLADTIISLQNDNGSMEPWFIEPNYFYDKDYLLTFYSGEAILALVDYHLRTNDELYLNAALKSQNYYIQKYVVNLKTNYYPAYVPWHAQSLNKIYKITKDKKYADAIFVMNDELLKIQNTSGLSHNEMLGRFYNPLFPQYGTPHSSSDAVFTEGLTYAYEIAELVNDQRHMAEYRKAIAMGVSNLINLQYTSNDLKIRGAIKYRYDKNSIRVDTTQHTVDAFTKIIEVFSSG